MADEFNEFFTTDGERASQASKYLAVKYDLPLNCYQPMLQDIPKDGDLFFFKYVSSSKIKKVVMSFPCNKAPGYDKVSMAVIKDALPCILPILTDIVNSLLQSSIFRNEWEFAETIPRIRDKEDNHEIANNNRPVSLLPAASKICERIVLNQLTEYLTIKKRLTTHQSGNKNTSLNRNVKYMYN